MVVSIDDARHAIWNLQTKDVDEEEFIHHQSMIITLDFLEDCGFDNLSLEESRQADNN